MIEATGIKTKECVRCGRYIVADWVEVNGEIWETCDENSHSPMDDWKEYDVGILCPECAAEYKDLIAKFMED